MIIGLVVINAYLGMYLIYLDRDSFTTPAYLLYCTSDFQSISGPPCTSSDDRRNGYGQAIRVLVQ